MNLEMLIEIINIRFVKVIQEFEESIIYYIDTI